MNMTNQYALFGHLIQTRGLQGQVVAQLASPIKTLDPVEFIFIQIGHTYVPYQVEEKGLPQSDQALFKLRGITDRSTAHEVVGKSIWLSQELLNQLVVKSTPQDQVVGYYVSDVKLGGLGVVKRIEVFPMHRCLVVDYQNKELLIPYVAALIQHLDHTNQQIIIKLPTGFLEAMGYQ
jgi:16S rRNA processing protein RimM